MILTYNSNADLLGSLGCGGFVGYSIYVLEGLRSRLKKNPRISGLRLSIAEKFLPADYYVQLRPPYATHTWEV